MARVVLCGPVAVGQGSIVLRSPYLSFSDIFATTPNPDSGSSDLVCGCVEARMLDHWTPDPELRDVVELCCECMRQSKDGKDDSRIHAQTCFKSAFLRLFRWTAAHYKRHNTGTQNFRACCYIYTVLDIASVTSGSALPLTLLPDSAV